MKKKSKCWDPALPYRINHVPITIALCLVATACQNILVDTEILDAPSISPASGAYGESQTVSISHTDPLAVIRYTTDGSEPNEASPEYAGPFTAGFGSTTVRAMAFKPGLKNSAIATRSIRVVWKKINTNKPWVDSHSFYWPVQSAEADGSNILALGAVYDSVTPVFYSKVFNTGTGNWTDPGISVERRIDACLIRHGGDLLLIGGIDFDSGGGLLPVARKHDGATWSDAGSITSRDGLAAVSDGINAYSIGGKDDTPTVLKTLEMYDVQTGTDAWIAKADLPGPRLFASAVLISGHIYVFGGYTDTIGTKVNTILDYSIASDSWTTLSTTMPLTNSYTSSVPWYDASKGRTMALVFGNHVKDGATDDPQVGEALFFDPQEGSVRIGTSMSLVGGDEARKSAAVNIGGRIFLVCASGNVWEYLPALDH